jgi:hypothetical protein
MNTPFTQASVEPYLSSKLDSTQASTTESSQSPQFAIPKNQYGENFVYPLVFFSIAVTLIYLFRTLFLKSPVIEQFKPPKQTSKYPCLNCKYFSNNPYLMCAISPQIALTEESKNCSDYQEKKIS